jgi:hypothetical protein
MELPEKFTIEVHPHVCNGRLLYCANFSVPKGAHIAGSIIGITVWRLEPAEAIQAAMRTVSNRISAENIKKVVAESEEFAARNGGGGEQHLLNGAGA